MKPKADLDHRKCIEMLKEQETPRNIFLHSRKVNAVAVFLAKKLIERGEKIDIHLVDMASLLHDLSKYREILAREQCKMFKHNYEGYNVLMGKGYPFIARIALKHGLDEILSEKYGLEKWEDMLVYYADKRVNHDKIVSIEGRFKYLKMRYGRLSRKAMERINASEKPVKELERQIFKRLDIKPSDINEESINPFLIDESY
jgi:uncharacterized protein